MKKNKLLKPSKIITVLIVLSAIAALAATASELLYKSTALSSFKLFKNENGLQYYTTTTHDYDVFRRFREQGEDLYLISSSKTVTYYLNAEGITGKVSWNVRKGSRFETAVWKRTENATELNVHGIQPVLVSGLGGCCGQLTGYRLFNLETGRILMSFNDFSFQEKVVQPFSLEIPNSPLKHRYIGALSQDSTRDRDFAPPQAGKSAVLLIKYATGDLQKQKIQVDMEVAEGFGASVLEMTLEKDPTVPNSDKIQISGNQTVLWNIDKSTNPNDISGVVLKIVLEGGKGEKTLRIPVKNDQFNLSSAQVPSGVAIRLL